MMASESGQNGKNGEEGRWSLPRQDLTQDKALRGFPTVEFEGQGCPSVGGVALLAAVGTGGYGQVYFGVDLRSEREVAVKVLPRALMEEQVALGARFVREARYTAKLRSPNLVRVIDVDQDAETHSPYMVMEFVQGISAKRWAATAFEESRPLDEKQVLSVCVAAGKGLEVAHLEGIVHRDVKPANILIPLRENGEPHLRRAKLADLGLARAEAEEKSLTGQNFAMGTPGFMPPEQARDARSVRKPADVFAMGATMYALLTGSAPFTGKTPLHVMVETVEGRHAPVTDRRPDLTPVTAEVVERCLEPEPEDRYPDAGALLDALAACK